MTILRRASVGAAILGLGAWAGLAAAGDGAAGDATTITIWRSGGLGYGASSEPGGAYVVEKRAMDVPASGELRLPGVSALIDAATVQLRSLSDPAGTSVVEQRMVAGGATPDALLGRRLGKSISVVTDHGEVTGILRAFDGESLVIEVGSGKDAAVEILRRGEHVVDVKLPLDAPVSDQPTLVWRVNAARPGPQQIEVSYRTDGLTWAPDYTATFDVGKQTVDFSAWATVANGTGAEWKDVELTLASGDSGAAATVPGAPTRPAAAPVSFKVPRKVHVGVGETIQVELTPPRTGVAARKVVILEPMPDQSAQYQAYPAQECYAYAPPGQGAKADVALEIDAPSTGQPLPEGRVRVMRRTGDKVEVGGEDVLKVNAATGAARIRLAGATDVTSEARQVDCRFDEHARQLHERVEVKVENHGKAAVDAIVRVFMYRWPSWKIEAEDEKGSRAGAQVQEYRVKLPAGGAKTLTYAVVYSW